jgi:hypothetical protein
VYGRDEHLSSRVQWSRFDSLAAAGVWLVALLRGDSFERPKSVPDAWERAAGSLLFDAFVNALDSVWPKPCNKPESVTTNLDWEDRSDGWARRMCVAAAERAAANKPARLTSRFDLELLDEPARLLMLALCTSTQDSW